MSPILTGVIASGISGHLTPPWSPEGAYDSLATISLSTATSSITFSGIPGGYKHLEVRGTYLASATNEDCLVRLSEDSASNYSWHELRGDGSTASARGVANTSFIYLGANSGSTTYPFNVVFNIPDYNSTTKYKTLKSLSGQDRNGTGGGISLFSGNWRSLSAVTSMTIYMASGNFNQYSQFALYGVK
jgi:hypothetical protein